MTPDLMTHSLQVADYITPNGHFILTQMDIKTAKVFRKNVELYYNFVTTHKNTCLGRICGLYQVGKGYTRYTE